jgi:hypothetical protein
MGVFATADAIGAETGSPSVWRQYYLYEMLIVVATIVIVMFVRWFLDPYFKYQSRKQVKDYEIYENGKCLTKKDLGTPFLLREQSE